MNLDEIIKGMNIEERTIDGPLETSTKETRRNQQSILRKRPRKCILKVKLSKYTVFRKECRISCRVTVN